jgi:transglutaminase-like putative cysteine protease
MGRLSLLIILVFGFSGYANSQQVIDIRFSESDSQSQKVSQKDNGPFAGITLKKLQPHNTSTTIPRTDVFSAEPPKFSGTIIEDLVIADSPSHTIEWQHGITSGQIAVKAIKKEGAMMDIFDYRLLPHNNGSLKVTMPLRYGPGLYTVRIMHKKDPAATRLSVLHSYEVDLPEDQAISPFLQPATRLQSDHEAIIQLANEIISDAGALTDREKSWAIFIWITDTLEPDWELHQEIVRTGQTNRTRSALETLQLGKSVCEGFVRLTVALHRAAGIPARVVGRDQVNGIGGARRSWAHAWAEIFVDGQWRAQDPYLAAGTMMPQGSTGMANPIFYRNKVNQRKPYFDFSSNKLGKSYTFIGNNVFDNEQMIAYNLD